MMIKIGPHGCAVKAMILYSNAHSYFMGFFNSDDGQIDYSLCRWIKKSDVTIIEGDKS